MPRDFGDVGVRKVSSRLLIAACAVLIAGCSSGDLKSNEGAGHDQGPVFADPFWRNATLYFLITDRFANGDPDNDRLFDRRRSDDLRGFEGGDIAGVTQKIRAGYFNDLGVDAIWLTPLIENTHGYFDEGYGATYAYHGYWPLDWTAVDPSFGSEREMAEMIVAAHERGLRVVADVIINHAGPVTDVDPKWPSTWVRKQRACNWSNYENNVSCWLAPTLQDIRTDTEAEVELPPFLLNKWRAEGRLDRELAELDAFFARTRLPRAPKNYLIKWLTDWVRDYGIDAFRVDTAKHVEPEVWAALQREATLALRDWRAVHAPAMPRDQQFHMFGELFNYGVLGFQRATEGGRAYDYGDRQVDFFAHRFAGMINMGFPTHAAASMQSLFQGYGAELNGEVYRRLAIVNYISSHDDMKPFDPARERPFESATKLMLAPGSAQIYYGDEVGRPLVVAGASGDANKRSMFDWQTLDNARAQQLLGHWRKLGRFRHEHLAVGAGVHRTLNTSPLIFQRTLDEGGVHDRVVVALGVTPGAYRVPIGTAFKAGERVCDAYGAGASIVSAGHVEFESVRDIVLLGECT